jgi:hypothetical protein
MDSLTIIGLSLNTLGSFVLAFALNKTTKMLDTSITVLEHFKDTYLAGSDVLSLYPLAASPLTIFRKS